MTRGGGGEEGRKHYWYRVAQKYIGHFTRRTSLSLASQLLVTRKSFVHFLPSHPVVHFIPSSKGGTKRMEEEEEEEEDGKVLLLFPVRGR